MSRSTLVLAALLAAPALARASILPSFDLHDCANRASHVVVVNDKGVVLESWRGDLKPGDRVPLDEFHLKLEQEVKEPFGQKPKAGPTKVTGKRLVAFLK